MNESLYHVLRGMMLSQSYIDQYTKRLAGIYKQDDVLQKFTVPRAALDRIELDLKFAVVVQSKPEENLSEDEKEGIVRWISIAFDSYFQESQSLESIDKTELKEFSKNLLNEMSTLANDSLSAAITADHEVISKKVRSIFKDAISNIKDSVSKDSPLSVLFSKTKDGKLIRSELIDIIDHTINECLEMKRGRAMQLIFETDKLAYLDDSKINSAKCYIEMSGKNIVITDKDGKKKSELI